MGDLQHGPGAILAVGVLLVGQILIERLHGGLYELHGEYWAITEAGIEYRPSSQVVLAEAQFPGPTARSGMTSPSDLGRWTAAPPTGADAAEWQHVLWRGLWHFPVCRGPARAQPVRFACKTLPKAPATALCELADEYL